MTDRVTSADNADVRFGGFRLFLLASCLLAAAASWLERSSLLEGLIVAAVALAAMLLLAYHVARTWSPADTAAEPPAAADSMVSRHQRRPRSRKRRLSEFRLDAIDRQLKQHEQTLRTVAQTTRQTQLDLTNRLDQLEQRLTDLQNTTHQQQAALQQTRRQHMQQLHQTLAQLATTLEQDTTPTDNH